MNEIEQLEKTIQLLIEENNKLNELVKQLINRLGESESARFSEYLKAPSSFNYREE